MNCEDSDEFYDFLKEKGLIKEEFEVGRWYKLNGHLRCYSDKHNHYGFYDSEWDGRQSVLNYVNKWTLATDKEVETALIKEAKKRFNVNNKIEYFIGNSKEQTIGHLNKFIYHPSDDELLIRGGCKGTNSGLVIYRKGKWATIIEEPKVKEMTMQEVNKALGYEIKIKE